MTRENFQQIREASSHLGIGLMIGAVACGVLDRTRGAAASQQSPYVPPPPAQQPYTGQQHGGWQAPQQR
ncbi:hypothetical protein [Streptomyces sp. NPDC020681]|uniref:hypothetical protein n=1 Tax=Streptomyces sp. NPDC020681 TaxID=3365083 RepID=UPI0037ABBF1C